MINVIFSRPDLRSNDRHAGIIGHWMGERENSAVVQCSDLGSAIDFSSKLAHEHGETCTLMYSMIGEPNAELWRCEFPGGYHDAVRALSNVNGWTWEPDTLSAVIIGPRPRRLDAMPRHTVTRCWAMLCYGASGELAELTSACEVL